MQEGLVSVVIPAYNCEKYIEKAINSVLQQTYRNFEIIVVDDCSTDKTWNIISKISEQEPLVRVVKNENNMGVAKTRNKAISLSRGEFVALLDSDDYWYKDKLEKQLKLQKETNAEVVYCSYEIVDDQGKKCCSDFIVPKKTNLQDTLDQSVISCSTALLKSEIALHYQFQDTFYHEDFVLWIDILKDGNRAVGNKEVLAAYRVQQGSRAANKIQSTKNRYQIIRNYLDYSFFKSVWIIMRFMWKGLVKYRPKR